MNREYNIRLPQRYTVSMTPEEARKRAKAAMNLNGVSFEVIPELDVPSGLVAGQTMVTNLDDLVKFNEKVNVSSMK